MRQLTVSFPPPEQPNGYILLYEMEYFPVDRNSCELFEVLFQATVVWDRVILFCMCLYHRLPVCLQARLYVPVVCLCLPLSVYLLSTVFFACVHTLSAQLNYTIV